MPRNDSQYRLYVFEGNLKQISCRSHHAIRLVLMEAALQHFFNSYISGESASMQQTLTEESIPLHGAEAGIADDAAQLRLATVMGGLRIARLRPGNGAGIVRAEAQGELQDLGSHHRPIRLHVFYVVEKDASYRQCFQIVDSRRIFFAACVRAGGMVHTHAHDLNGMRILLELTQRLQRVDPLLERLRIADCDGPRDKEATRNRRPKQEDQILMRKEAERRIEIHLKRAEACRVKAGKRLGERENVS